LVSEFGRKSEIYQVLEDEKPIYFGTYRQCETEKKLKTHNYYPASRVFSPKQKVEKKYDVARYDVTDDYEKIFRDNLYKQALLED